MGDITQGTFNPAAHYPWHLTELPVTSREDDRPNVVTTFSSGGGSTMGYKLAGYHVDGAVDIDPEMMEVYSRNFTTPNKCVMGVGDVVKNRPDLVEKWQDIDVLDGSPPCTLFSKARKGGGEGDWGKTKKFREGQAEQVLDRLFFDYLDLVKALNAKTFIAENVATMAQGKARGYVKAVVETAKRYGYRAQVFIVRASDQGVPQQRNRIFFIGIRDDLAKHLPLLPAVPPAGQVVPELALGNLKCDGKHEHVKASQALAIWNAEYRYNDREKMTASGFTPYYSGSIAIRPNKQCTGIAASAKAFVWSCPRWTTPTERKRMFSFPDDYQVPDRLVNYVTGMSVPPFLMRGVAAHVKTYWLDKMEGR